MVVGNGGDKYSVFKMLQEGRAFLRPVPEFDALRLSMAYYTTEDDFERAFTMLEEL